jgi:hypothetical protein
VQYLLIPAEQTETLPNFFAIRTRRLLTPDFDPLRPLGAAWTNRR